MKYYTDCELYARYLYGPYAIKIENRIVNIDNGNQLQYYKNKGYTMTATATDSSGNKYMIYENNRNGRNGILAIPATAHKSPAPVTRSELN